jgi:hypothetical protein
LAFNVDQIRLLILSAGMGYLLSGEFAFGDSLLDGPYTDPLEIGIFLDSEI